MNEPSIADVPTVELTAGYNRLSRQTSTGVRARIVERLLEAMEADLRRRAEEGDELAMQAVGAVA